MNENFLLAWLCRKTNLTLPRYFRILESYKSLEEALKDDFGIIKKSEKWLDKVSCLSLNNEIKVMKEQLHNNKVSLLTFKDKNYPPSLLCLENRIPIVLYYQGSLQALNTKKLLTIVGSRNIQTYSKSLLKSMLKSLCDNEVTTISGLAAGVDTLVHHTSTENHSKTVAVIGSGLDSNCFYPSQNLRLKNQIIEEGGLVISEHYLGTKAKTYHFPQRNRILAALSEITWVVQAGQRSGTLITASHARDLGKTVATSPASIFDPYFAGNIQLLKDGANIITDAEDISQLLGLSTFKTGNYNPPREAVLPNKISQEIYQALSFNPVDVDTLSENLSIPIRSLISELTFLELEGLASNEGSNNWIKLA
ncbi:MAG: DNA-processing protein DprA [Patescibacteria group bacterium]